MIEYCTADTQEDLQQILNLQAMNLADNISQQELEEQGFVTVKHTLEVLTKMNLPYGHIIAKSSGVVIAYALVMLRDFAKDIPALWPMFEQINELSVNDELLKDSRYFVMGQVCIAKEFRSQGVFPGLYQHMKTCMSPKMDYLVTEIAEHNVRSCRAHEKVGFKNIKTYKHQKDNWNIVVWDWI